MEENLRVKSYQLHILVEHAVTILIGKLGSFQFPAGNYIYTGSGKTNLVERVFRHLSDVKKLRWHIDYLLSDSAVEIVGVTLSEEAECKLNQETAGEIIVPRFGAMDCRSRCGSHLKYLGVRKPTEDFTKTFKIGRKC